MYIYYFIIHRRLRHYAGVHRCGVFLNAATFLMSLVDGRYYLIIQDVCVCVGFVRGSPELYPVLDDYVGNRNAGR